MPTPALSHLGVFAQHSRGESVVATSEIASLATTTPTNTHLLFQAGELGSLVTRVTAIPRATVAATNLCLFVSYDEGATKHFLTSELMDATTVNTTTKTKEVIFKFFSKENPYRLPGNARLYAGIMVERTSGVVFSATGADF